MSVIEHYQRSHPRARPSLGSKEARLIRARFKDGYSAADLRKAIDGYHLDPFHCGKNPDNQKHQHLTLIMRDATHVQMGLEFADKPATNGVQQYQRLG